MTTDSIDPLKTRFDVLTLFARSTLHVEMAWRPVGADHFLNQSCPFVIQNVGNIIKQNNFSKFTIIFIEKFVFENYD